MAPKCEVTILHFNDVYNVGEQKYEPVAGAARFCSALKSFQDLNPLILFSGDIVAPSIMSTFTKGKQMVPVLRHCGVHYSVFGNHDFDFGLQNTREFAEQTEIPWMMSNVVDNETGMPLGDGSISHIVKWGGKTFGLVGLVEREWLETLSTINPEEVTYQDYVEVGKKLASELREQGAEYIIALTHMRTPNDLRLLNEVDTIDLILGGHDHTYEVHQEGPRYLIKSGTDFRQFSKITLSFDPSGQVDVTVAEIQVTSAFQEDQALKDELKPFNDMVSEKMEDLLATFSVDLDGRFSKVRTGETNLGNWVCDVMLASLNADLVILNSGTLRSDRIHPSGEFKYRDLAEILPMADNMLLVMVKGKTVVEALENGVSQYPRLEGRFPQVSGLSFGFDPTLPVGQRIDPRFVKVGDEYINLEQEYMTGMKEYMYLGRDGYKMFGGCRVLVDGEEAPQLQTAILNHFTAIKTVTKTHHTRHRPSLVTLSRRHSLVRMLSRDSNSLVAAGHSPSASRRTSIDSVADMHAIRPLRRLSSCSIDDFSPLLLRVHKTDDGHHAHSLAEHPSPRRDNSLSPLIRRKVSPSRSDSVTIEDLEMATCKLAPKLEQRIVVLTEETRDRFFADHEWHHLEKQPILEEVEPSSPPPPKE